MTSRLTVGMFSMFGVVAFAMLGAVMNSAAGEAGQSRELTSEEAWHLFGGATDTRCLVDPACSDSTTKCTNVSGFLYGNCTEALLKSTCEGGYETNADTDQNQKACQGVYTNWNCSQGPASMDTACSRWTSCAWDSFAVKCGPGGLSGPCFAHTAGCTEMGGP